MTTGDEPLEICRCPGCSEEVPRTLYCLNCGYPLYKIEWRPPSRFTIISVKIQRKLSRMFKPLIHIGIRIRFCLSRYPLSFYQPLTYPVWAYGDLPDLCSERNVEDFLTKHDFILEETCYEGPRVRQIYRKRSPKK